MGELNILQRTNPELFAEGIQNRINFANECIGVLTTEKKLCAFLDRSLRDNMSDNFNIPEYSFLVSKKAVLFLR